MACLSSEKSVAEETGSSESDESFFHLGLSPSITRAHFDTLRTGYRLTSLVDISLGYSYFEGSLEEIEFEMNQTEINVRVIPFDSFYFELGYYELEVSVESFIEEGIVVSELKGDMVSRGLHYYLGNYYNFADSWFLDIRMIGLIVEKEKTFSIRTNSSISNQTIESFKEEKAEKLVLGGLDVFTLTMSYKF
ncbi:hypothetical protein N9W79_02065 [bacterium]|nr:hypothetical protein [bacterium]